MKIDDLIGKPYLDGGRGPDAYDCYGLFEELCRRRGLALPPEPNPITREDKAAAIQAEIARGHWRRLDAPEPGCAVVFCIVPPYVTHIGMVLDDRMRFVHVRQGTDVTIERLAGPLWASRIAGFYAHV